MTGPGWTCPNARCSDRDDARPGDELESRVLGAVGIPDDLLTRYTGPHCRWLCGGHCGLVWVCLVHETFPAPVPVAVGFAASSLGTWQPVSKEFRYR